jgi:hydroxymethylglutaryl-CoA reductase (NADPH)
MPTSHHTISDYLGRLFRAHTPEELRRRFAPDNSAPPPSVPGGTRVQPEALKRRWQLLHASAESREALLDSHTRAEIELYQHNIENCIGTVKVPVGIAGPLRVRGLAAHGDYYVPLATTEAALVASYSRGARTITEAGGCTSVLLQEGISRAPGFAFQTILEVGEFSIWCVQQLEKFREQAAQTTRHGALVQMSLTVEGNHVYLKFEFTTGDASGQNMATIATKAICDYIREHSPVKPQYYFVEANLSGDKKATALSFLSVRGKKVSAEVLLPAALVEKRLHTTPQRMERYWRMSSIGGIQSGALGIHGHYANGLAALYIACGQDPACVAESAVGITRFEVADSGGLYASVSLPNIVVGTVGGGTGLPSQHACLDVMGLAGQGHAQELAEVAAALALAGELSITAAICADEFAGAHQRLARGRKKPGASGQKHDG